MSVVLRPAVGADQAFIFSTCLKGLRHGSSLMRKVPTKVYFREQHATITRIILRGATVLVAHPEGDPDVIVGYVIAEPGVLHWVYVKEAFRMMGVARTMLNAVAPLTEFSQWVRAADMLAPKFKLTLNPWRCNG